MADLSALKQAVLTEHEQLTADCLAKQAAAESAWAAYEQAKAALQAFKGEYGKVVRALKGDVPKSGGVTAGGALGTPKATLKAGGK